MQMQSLGSDLYRFRTGLILGGVVGLFSGGFWGLFFGAVLGFMVERAIRKVSALTPQQIFFKATFTVMGRVAKADGQVTETEIEFARAVMARMQLSDEKRREAIDCFTEGKDPDFDLRPVLAPLAQLMKYRQDLRLIFIEIQLQSALADGEISSAERHVLIDVCSQLGFDVAAIEALIQRVQAEQSFHQSHGSAAPTQSQLDQAYGVLGVSDSASDSEVKRAWRKLMSQHHPDKLVAKGLPEEMMLIAKEKTQEIQAAYDLIRKSRAN